MPKLPKLKTGFRASGKTKNQQVFNYRDFSLRPCAFAVIL